MVRDLCGWAAATGSLDIVAWAIVLVVYLWQIPHFLAIAWIYKDDYERGGFQMLPLADPAGRVTGRQSMLGALALIPVSLLPSVADRAGMLYFAGAVVLGLLFLRRAVAFAIHPDGNTARLLMRGSLLYLPALLTLLCIDWIG